MTIRDAGSTVLDCEPVELTEIVRRALESLRAEAAIDAESISLAPESTPVLVGNGRFIAEAVQALLAQAAQRSRATGPIRVLVALDTGDAVFTLRSARGSIFPQAMGPLGGSDGSADACRLSIVQGLVAKQGGTLTLFDAADATAEVVLRFPLGAAPDSAPCRSETAPRVLIVEDNDDNRETLERLLEIWGYRVDTAADGHAGLHAALAELPDIAIIDVGLPGLDGHQIARELRAAPGGTNVFLIALTGYSGRDEELRAYNAGFDVHVVKPVDADDLASLLARVSRTPAG